MKNTNISSDTIARTIVLFLALLNQVLTVTGLNPLDIAEENVYQLVTLAATIGASVIAFWKNNSFTKNAQKADEVLRELKEADGGAK